MQRSTDEIKTIIILSGSKRLLHLEQEIFADKELSRLYLHNLCNHEKWYSPEDHTEWFVYDYSKYILGCRWPEAEVVFRKDHYIAWYHYCNLHGIERHN